MNPLFISAIDSICENIRENKEYLTNLDAAIGDADHGINMTRGFDAVMGALRKSTDTDISGLLKKVGMTLISTVGGASGPLYGTAFLRAAGVLQDKHQIDKNTAAMMFAAVIQGIKDRGKAVRGEKTMLDALEPANEAFIKCSEEGGSLIACMEMACKAAEEGVLYTKTIKATKGRASYLGDRSIGHQDPGATSTSIILKTLTDFYRTNILEAK
jgi:dihydroxyacetone kinase-like protein